MTQTSSTLAAGNIRRSDLNKIVDDVTDLYSLLPVNVVTAEVTSTTTTNSTTYVDAVAGLAATITTTGGKLLIMFTSSPATVSNLSSYFDIAFQVNGTDYKIASLINGGSGTTNIIAAGHKVVSGLAAGTYTVKVRNKVNNSAGSCTLCNSGAATLTVIELPV